MSKIYNNGIVTTAGFQYNANSPLDDRLVVETYDDLSSITKYEGMLVYVKEEDKYYTYTNSEWGEFPALGEIDSRVDDLETKVGDSAVAEQINKALEADVTTWDEIDNRPSIEKGEGENSIVIGEGGAIGEGSLAGGTTDKTLLENIVGSLATLADLKPAKASAPLTISYGANNESVVAGAGTIGVENTAGVKGYYWDTIDFTTNTIKLSNTRRVSTFITPNYPTEFDWIAGDTINIVNDKFYYGQIKITAIDKANSTITVDSLPFTEIAYQSKLSVYTYNSPSDRTIYATYSLDKDDLNNKIKPRWVSRTGVVDIGFAAFSLGVMNLATGMLSIATGKDNWAAASCSTVLGYQNQSLGRHSIAKGTNCIAYGDNSSAEGCGTKAIGYAAHTEGYQTEAGLQAHAEGNNSKATGIISHAEGHQTTTTGEAAHAEGKQTEATNTAAHAEGFQTKATNIGSHAEGVKTEASGYASHTEGQNTVAAGIASHTEGYSTIQASTVITNFSANDEIISKWTESKFSLATAQGSHVEGNNNLALAKSSHAEGQENIATQPAAHAEGYQTKAKAYHSHAEGNGTEAIGHAAHAEGKLTVASGQASHAGGTGTIASANSQTAIGKYNEKDTNALFIVGNGTSDTDRHNALVVKSNGTVLSNNIQLSTVTEVNELKDRINSLSSGGLTRAIVDTLPDASTANENIIYMIPAENADEGNIYDEYMFFANSDGVLVPEVIGSTSVDLSGYLPLTGGTISENINEGKNAEVVIQDVMDGELIPIKTTLRGGSIVLEDSSTKTSISYGNINVQDEDNNISLGPSPSGSEGAQQNWKEWLGVPDVDQTYNSESENAQSGTAVAGALEQFMSYINSLQEQLNNKSQVQIITWEDDD